MRVLTYLRQKYLIINNNAFYWDSKNRIVHKIDKINSTPILSIFELSIYFLS